MTALSLNTRYVRYFLAVVDEGSFSRAADRLNISQPAVSRRIKILEEELGFALLERLPRHIEPTEQARALLPAFRELVRHAGETGKLAHQLAAQKATPPRIGVAVYPSQAERSELLAEFEAAFPNATYEIETGYTKALLHGLWEGKFDILSIYSPLPDARFEYVALRWYRIKVALPEESPLASLETVPLAALRGLAIVTFERRFQPRIYEQVIVPLEAAGACPIFPGDQGRFGVLNHAAGRRSAMILSFDEYRADDLARSGLVARPLEGVKPVVALIFLRIASEDQSRSQRLWEFARRWAAKRGVPQSPQ
jgi:DNA-binding transcriptional LysR family regulator